MKLLRRLFCLLCALALASGSLPLPAQAASYWPEDIEISAEGGILMDADTGTVLYGKNIHTAYYPASITKILTALIVIENCDLNETVTFSHDAVFNVETGSSSAALDVGDQLSVRDCLYAMLLKSANEAANALAEHAAGSISAFAELMNARAAELGCTDSHFNNPSGLNDPEHYTSAHDMALIAQAAFRNETFVEIDSTLYYDLPVTKRNPEGLRIYPGHRMLKKNTSQYYPGIVGGKTGYTSLAGNTLVTCAEQNGMRLIAVVLNGHLTHYTDTKALLNFGFRNFKKVNVSDIDNTYASVENDLTISGLPAADLSILQLAGNQEVVLPDSADYTEIVPTISYELPEQAPDRAIAKISYEYCGRIIGSSWLLLNEEGASATEPAVEVTEAAESTSNETAAETPEENETKKARFSIVLPKISLPQIPPEIAWILAGVLAAAVLAAGLIVIRYRTERHEEEERLTRYQRRQNRLQDMGISNAEFDLLLEQKRTSSTVSGETNKPAKKPKRHKSFLDHKSWKS